MTRNDDDPFREVTTVGEIDNGAAAAAVRSLVSANVDANVDAAFDAIEQGIGMCKVSTDPLPQFLPKPESK